MCKRSDTFSLRVLIGRGLDLLPEFLSFRETNLFFHASFSVLRVFLTIVGVYYSEGPPVPIPNTVVKLVCAENTWRAASRENRSMPTQRSPLWAALFFLFLLSSVGRACGC